MTDVAIEYKHTEKIYVRSHLGRKTYTTALDNLNFQIKKGEIYGILGLNGAGKTTAMKLALGLLFPTKGNIFINGLNVSENHQIRKFLGYLPETAYFNTTLTAFETVNFYGRLSRVRKSKKEIYDILNSVGLKGQENKKLAEFSKGMLQRVGFAQAVVHNPEILLLDEPASGLDPLAIHDFRNIIQKINEKGKTVFLSSHSISETEKMCSRVGILVNGKLKKTVTQNEWQSNGGLEKIFVETVR